MSEHELEMIEKPICEICDKEKHYSSYNVYLKHLKTKKHLKNAGIGEEKKEECAILAGTESSAILAGTESKNDQQPKNDQKSEVEGTKRVMIDGTKKKRVKKTSKKCEKKEE